MKSKTMKKNILFNLIFVFIKLSSFDKQHEGPLFEDFIVQKPLINKIAGTNKPNYYMGSLSETENPTLSWQGYIVYLITNFECMRGNTAFFTDVDNENNINFYVCSRDEQDFNSLINRAKKNYEKLIKDQGSNLKEKNSCVVIPLKSGESFFIAAHYDENLEKIDPVVLMRQVTFKMKNSLEGVHLIDGVIVKISKYPAGSEVLLSQVIPSKDEVAQFKK